MHTTSSGNEFPLRIGGNKAFHSLIKTHSFEEEMCTLGFSFHSKRFKFDIKSEAQKKPKKYLNHKDDIEDYWGKYKDELGV
jgi:hypothetical protein